MDILQQRRIFEDLEEAKKYYSKTKKKVGDWSLDDKSAAQCIADLKEVGKFLKSKGLTDKELNRL